jgi:hypothetical protein
MSEIFAKMTALDDSRLQLLCLHFGSTDEPSGVPADRRKEFETQIEYNIDFAKRWFADVCTSFGSPSGFFEDVPPADQAEALRHMEFTSAIHAARCAFELRLRRISIRETAVKAAKPKPQKAVVSPKGVTTADLLADE